MAVPTYARLYGVDCSNCHSMWGSLNVNGATFRLSGYRAMAGQDLPPLDKPIEIGKGGAVSLPGVFPISLITGVAIEYRREQRDAPAALRDPPGESGPITRAGSNFTVADASIFLSAPLGKHLSFFIEFPMFETKAWEFTPTGPGEARVAQHGNIQLPTETPVFEVAKFWWNNLLGSRAPRDSVNLLGGITQLPLAYPSGKVRLSVNQYLVYERRGLDYISPRRVDDLFTDPAISDRLFRLSEPQGLLEVNGMIVPGAPVDAVAKPQTPWLEYHVGGTTASNAASDGNLAKGVYGRFVGRWYGQALGVFGIWTPNLVDDAMISAATLTGPGGARIIKDGHFQSARVSAGPDATLSLAPFKIPVSLENNVLYSRESNPTGYGKEFAWWGGFHQLNYFPTKRSVVYARYDWILGDYFDDTGAGGDSKAHPREWDLIGGLQFLVLENLKLIGEYRHHEFDDRITGGSSTLKDDGFTVRAMTGF
ncbi:hypothetical protein [Anaeromyxobacter oryzae]|uniref:hypothetical protein n=1 Tax=Anaeromyxobacter oryzae TaxID=2918170 RepID=UPI0020BE5439|nr:hypothetical protein [Anaeromyxobacter oryzae]